MCEENEIEFLPKQSREYYGEFICFANLSQISFKNNWFVEHYEMPFVTITPCDFTNRTDCKSHEESRNFLNKITFFLMTKET